MGSSYRTASSRQRESRSPPGSEIKDRNTWGVQDITGITYRACEETRRAHTQVKARAWKASSPAPSAPAGPSSRASTARMYLGCFDRQTAFSISVSVLVVPWGASDLSSSTPDPTHAPWTRSTGVWTTGRPRSPAFSISGQLKIKTSDTRSSSHTLSFHTMLFFSFFFFILKHSLKLKLNNYLSTFCLVFVFPITDCNSQEGQDLCQPPLYPTFPASDFWHSVFILQNESLMI